MYHVCFSVTNVTKLVTLAHELEHQIDNLGLLLIKEGVDLNLNDPSGSMCVP